MVRLPGQTTYHSQTTKVYLVSKCQETSMDQLNLNYHAKYKLRQNFHLSAFENDRNKS